MAITKTAEHTALIHSRGIIKGKLTRAKAFLDNFDANVSTIHHVTTKLNIIKEVNVEFESAQAKIEAFRSTVSDADLADFDEGESSERESFENSFCDASAKAAELISRLSVGNNAEAPAAAPITINTTHSHTHSGKSKRVELPKRKIQPFSGAYIEWLPFYDMYKALIHDNQDLDDVEKFWYLIEYLKGPALDVIKGIQVTKENYKIAFEALFKRYNKQMLIVGDHIQDLIDSPVMTKESGVALQAALDCISRNDRALANLKSNTYDAVMIHIASTKLDPTSHREWSSYCKDIETVKLDDFKKFLEERCLILTKEIVRDTQSKSAPSAAAKPSTAAKPALNNQRQANFHVSSNNAVECPLCKSNHRLYECAVFKNLTIASRLNEIKRLQLCNICLSSHNTPCKSNYKCRACGLRLSSLLHEHDSRANNKGNASARPPNNCQTSNAPTAAPHNGDSSYCITGCDSTVLLMTARINILDSRGNVHECRALIDSASMVNFITDDLCTKLGLPRQHNQGTVSGVEGSAILVGQKTHATCSSKYNNFNETLLCSVVKTINESLPPMPVDMSRFDVPTGVTLADPDYNTPGKIDLLIGGQCYHQLMCVGMITFGEKGPALMKTKLGWVWTGPVPRKAQKRRDDAQFCGHIAVDPLVSQLQKFWEIEEVSTVPKRSAEDQQCEDNFTQSLSRAPDGRLSVSYPIKRDAPQLGDSWPAAHTRLLAMERKFKRQPVLAQRYKDFMSEYELMGHMTEIDPGGIDKGKIFYLPHHAVLREDSLTTKLRVVFDGSAKSSNGVAVNDLLLPGPTVQDDLFSILIRFRQHLIVLGADIEKMFRQISVAPHQRDLQRILWRNSPEDPVKIFRLNTVTYGLVSSPFVAVRSLHEVANQNLQQYPRACSTILKDFYVDDLLTGADTAEEVIQLKSEVSTILSSAQLPLRKWTTNDPTVAATFEESSLASPIHVFDDEHKTLGLRWNAHGDVLQYKLTLEEIPQRVTKRNILSVVSQVFDPLGLIGPITVKGKIFLQRLWEEKVDWDESLPTNLHTQWLNYLEELKQINCFSIPRCTVTAQIVSIELHGFCDASEQAYGACLYVRATDTEGHVSTRLLCAKSKVAPLKKTTLPRLELCGALKLAELHKKVRGAWTKEIDRVYFWCDSTITLGWIRNPSSHFKTFVANRVAEIQELTDPGAWHYVKSKENPADIISRGSDPVTLQNSALWRNGPEWLLSDTEAQLHAPIDIDLHELPERKGAPATFANVVNEPSIVTRFSDLNKIKRIFALCHRFINNCREKEPANRIDRHEPFSVFELNIALNSALRFAQIDVFSREIKALETKKPIAHTSALRALNVFLDENQLLRVGGRLRNSQLDYCQKYGIILPKNHNLTEQIIREEHKRHLHAGTQALLYALREYYWVISGRETIKRVLRKCLTCFRARPTTLKQTMGNLPPARVILRYAFYSTGVDCAGPYYVKVSRNVTVKVWLCIFVCMSTKAVHLELACELTTEAFLKCFKRFISRRGIPNKMFSDNGTNFVGANNELQCVYELLTSPDFKGKLLTFCQLNKIEWSFTPPYAPHFSGLWEAGVKSVKTHLRRVVSSTPLTYEELYTVFTMIEACLNSRPLTPTSTDPEDLLPLSPAHFLIGQPLTALPQVDFVETPQNRLTRYGYMMRLQQDFWSRWNKEYLSELQQRNKWRNVEERNLSPNDMVILKEDNVAPCQWRVGRVTETHPGEDGIVRVASVRTATGTVKRAITKLCLLPIEKMFECEK